MATMHISLPDEMQSIVEARVRAGIYSNASDYVRELIRSDLAAEGDWMTPEIAAAIDEGEASGISDKTFDEIIAEARAEYEGR